MDAHLVEKQQEIDRAKFAKLKKKLTKATNDLIVFGIDLSDETAERSMLIGVPPIMTEFPNHPEMKWRRYDDNPPDGPLERALFQWKAGFWFDTHYHLEQETIHIKRGRITLYVMIDGKTEGFILDKGDTYTVPAGAKHKGYSNLDTVLVASYLPPMPHQEEGE